MAYDWGFYKTPSQLDLMSVEWLWQTFYRTEDDDYAMRIRAVLIARGEIHLEPGES